MERQRVEDGPGRAVGGEDGGPRVSFGAKLKGLREAAGFTQEELASRAGLTAKAVSALERGERRRPYPHTVRCLADALGLPDAARAAFLASVPGRGTTGSIPDEAPSPALMVPPTSLVGRGREVEEMSRLMGQGAARLLTLTGTGGVGKTRLALEVAREAVGSFQDGVVFVGLAPLKDASLVLPTMAKALTLRDVEGLPSREALKAHLREKRMLLVLDNFEHVLEAAPEVAGLIEACPDLTVLATSRAPLRVRGEQEYPVSPLGVPDPSHVPDLEDVGGSPAARLFVERARTASPAFELTRHNAASVAAICWRLDGLPLALELAAARARFLGPAALLSRLDRALEAGGARDLPERQRTMRATLDWSYDLLHGPEKELFARLSVFAGGFTLEAAEVVGADEYAGDVLVLLGNLVEQSLVLARPDDGADGVRYGMLEPVRQYALEKLENGGGSEETRRRHAGYYLALAEEGGPSLKNRDQAIWLPRFEAEIGNLRAALSWAVEHGWAREVSLMSWASWTYWWLSGHLSEGRRWMEEALASDPDAPAPVRATLLTLAATLGQALGDFEASRRTNDESMELFRRLGDEDGLYFAMGTAGLIALGQGQPNEALSMMEESGERRLEGMGDRWSASAMFGFSATVALGMGDRARARRLAGRALSLAREIGAREAIAVALPTLAVTARDDGDLERAAALFAEGLTLSAEVGDRTNIAYYLEGLAELSASENGLEQAARLWGAARTLLETIEVIAYPHAADRTFYEERLAAARASLDERAWEKAWSEGRAMTTEEAVEYALDDRGD
ncbi:helix-turn-helix domain-containing protein [Rubrobacter tropicus]|uniref:Helix-turn-helix domain-containing protein n=1 Tax=Rubrobacter tropicus TaxID=2653851 RepID=A0A6G8Q7F6_9ACTN|nr:helix-turn-helix domain-containing protein [Rubrobacter tropicus]QIN82257.1 helix-turn-helix domain-containing protein [Rubrobacter tropicus]